LINKIVYSFFTGLLFT